MVETYRQVAFNGTVDCMFAQQTSTETINQFIVSVPFNILLGFATVSTLCIKLAVHMCTGTIQYEGSSDWTLVYVTDDVHCSGDCAL